MSAAASNTKTWRIESPDLGSTTYTLKDEEPNTVTIQFDPFNRH